MDNERLYLEILDVIEYLYGFLGEKGCMKIKADIYICKERA